MYFIFHVDEVFEDHNFVSFVETDLIFYDLGIFGGVLSIPEDSSSIGTL